MKILKKITHTTPPNGCISLKSSSQNKLENVVYYNQETSKLINFNILSPSAVGLIGEEEARNAQEVPVKRKVGRPRNDSKKLYQNTHQELISQMETELISHRNKYGRVIKIANKDVAKILQVDQEISPKEIEQIPVQNNIIIQQPVTTTTTTTTTQLLPGLEPPRKKKRKISAEFRCTTCKKVAPIYICNP